mgnify:CR=1 FL=1
MRCRLWRRAAENGGGSLQKGMRGAVTGRLRQRSYDTKEGEKRTVIELEVDEIGPSLTYATAKVNRTARQGGASGGGCFGNSGGFGSPPPGPAGDGRPARLPAGPADRPALHKVGTRERGTPPHTDRGRGLS